MEAPMQDKSQGGIDRNFASAFCLAPQNRLGSHFLVVAYLGERFCEAYLESCFEIELPMRKASEQSN